MADIDTYERVFDQTLGNMARDLAAVQDNADYSDERKARDAAAIRAAGEAKLKDAAAALVKAADDAAQAADAAYHKAANDFDASFDPARLQWLAGETAARLAGATAAEIAEVMEAARASGDRHKVRSTRRAALERAQSIAGDQGRYSQDERMAANRLARALAAEGDSTPEIEAARAAAADVRLRASLVRSNVQRVGERLHPTQFLARSFFADELGEPPAGQVVWRRKDGGE